MTDRPDVHAWFDPATHTLTYLASDPVTGAAVIIDPVLDFDAPAARRATGSRRMSPSEPRLARPYRWLGGALQLWRAPRALPRPRSPPTRRREYSSL